MKDKKIEVKDLAVGYGKRVVVDDISFYLEKGKIFTLLGPNGSGKSTILKTITKQLTAIQGEIKIEELQMKNMTPRQVAKQIAMVTTEKIDPELMTCEDVVSTGRYVHTGRMGILLKEDRDCMEAAMKHMQCWDLRKINFSSISDGQRQRVMFARAICQNTDILVLDEPTSYLDIKYKLEILESIRKLAYEKKVTVIMSLHELDLAMQVSDYVATIRNHKMDRMGTVEEIYKDNYLQELYQIDKDCFDEKTGRIFMKQRTSIICEKKEAIKSCMNAETKGKERKKSAKVIMVQGTMSNAGKSFLVAGLCRVFKQDGYRVAPFKSQNMALNSYITKDGLEMGRAQVMQAEAAGIEPSVQMNPILLKPTNDRGSQVIVNGKVLGNMSAKDYFLYKKRLLPEIKKAYEALEENVDIIVIEGAGSPAEINLKENDIVNMGVAKLVDAPVILVGDIDRGGVFAQLLGTLSLLEQEEWRRVVGLVINKFRGDKSILEPGIKMIEEKGEKPVIGVLPYINIAIDDEDSLSQRMVKRERGCINIAVVRLPRISNFSDFTVFEFMEGVKVIYVDTVGDLKDSDMVIIPGSKNTIGDLKWLRESGLEAAIKRYATEKPVFGICGGYQMLGRKISDPYKVEEGGEIRGMELLEIETILEKEKVRKQVAGSFGEVRGIFDGLTGKAFKGYEIHMGSTKCFGNPLGMVEEREEGCFSGNVYGSYVHGIFDEGGIASYLVKVLAKRKGIVLEEDEKMSNQQYKEREYDKLADMVRKYMDIEELYNIMEKWNTCKS